jgi:hypothetical protein
MSVLQLLHLLLASSACTTNSVLALVLLIADTYVGGRMGRWA